MTNDEIKEIVILQKRGIGYTKIAAITRQPINTVKSHVARHPVELEDVCLFCGKLLRHIDHCKRKTFCSSICKNKWWYAHQHRMIKQTLNAFICPACGKEFKDYGKRIYCSVGCYAMARRKNNG